MDDMMDKEYFLAHIRSAHGRWEAAVASIPQEQMAASGFCGTCLSRRCSACMLDDYWVACSWRADEMVVVA